MSARNKPYDQYGPYILFKRLEADALGDLWRAGRIDGSAVGPVVALRRFTGGNRDAFVSAVGAASHILPQMSGTSFVRDQHAGVADGVPFLAWEYAGGRSLRHIIDRARGSKDVPPNPLPLDQAIVIAEKVALSVTTMAELRDAAGVRLSHGALIPQFIWISDDGEIRVAGQQMGNALIASMSDQKVAADAGRYFSPEYRQSGQPDKNADVYSLGAILFLLVTGHEPPDAATASAFGAAVRAAKTMTGTAIPDDIRLVLDKSFNLDPSMRYASIGDMKQAISALAHSGRYSATTFNLAFYLSTLLKKEMEAEAVDREKESKVNVAPYLEAARPAPAAMAPVVPMAATPAVETVAAKKSRLPIAIAAGVTLAALGVAGYMMIGKSSSQPPAKQVVAAQTLPAAAPPSAPLIAEPIAVSAPSTVTGTAPVAATTDAEAQKKAFEEAVRQRMQAEMMKLQNDFMSELKKKQSKDAPVNAAAVSAPAAPAPALAQSQPAVQTASAEDRAPSAAQLDQQRRDTRAEEAAQAVRTPAPPIQTQTSAPAVAAPSPVAQAAIREGDVIDHNALDVRPRMTRPVKPVYPPMAARQKIEATIFLTVFVGEQGQVLDVKVLRGDTRFGLNEAAVRAMRSAQFTPGIKDGKRVRTWYPQSIVFKMN